MHKGTDGIDKLLACLATTDFLVASCFAGFRSDINTRAQLTRTHKPFNNAQSGEVRWVEVSGNAERSTASCMPSASDSHIADAVWAFATQDTQPFGLRQKQSVRTPHSEQGSADVKAKAF